MIYSRRSMLLIVLVAALGWSVPAHASVPIVYPAGTFTPAQTVFTAADQPVTIRCAGPAQTFLIMPSGFDITYNDLNKAPVIDGCTLVTEAAGGGTAIRIAGPVAPTSTVQGPQITNVHFRGSDLTADYWSRGIDLVDVWNPVLRDINGKGLDQLNPPFLMASCLEFERSQVVDVEKFDCYHAQTAVVQTGATYGEGFSLRDFNFVGVNLGVSLTTGAGYVIADGHVNAANGCIEGNGKVQLVLQAVLCYKTHVSTQDFVGFFFSNAQQLHVVNSTVSGSTAATEAGHTAGMVLGAVFYSQFVGNTCENFKLTYGCIIVGSLSHDNLFTANQSRSGAGTVVQINPDAGSNNKLNGNWGS